ncbi:MAG: PASTA domain-containing protein [Luteibaculum sp.]
MRKIIEFLASKYFFINLAIAIVIVITIGYFANSYLKGVTKHGDKVQVPALIGRNLVQADSALLSEGLRYQVIDSVFEEGAEPGEVIEQIPAAFQNVKPGRTIYLTINTLTPPNVAIPNLKNMSLRQAVATLEVLGLALHKLEYEPDICTDCVLKQLLGKELLEPGTMVPKGTAVTLVLGQGMGNADVQIPYLIGQSLEEAVRTLIDKSLNVGDVNYTECETKQDSNIAKVYRQSPAFYPGNRLNLGGEISLWFTADTASIKIENADSLLKAYQEGEAEKMDFNDTGEEEEEGWN